MGNGRPTRFEWRIYADATCAGLATLLPLPGLDLLVELVFRRHLPHTIARRRGVQADRAMLRRLGGSGEELLSLAGCLAMLVLGLFWLIKRISRKILYFLTIKEAAQQLSSYWHRAYLIDYLLHAGHLAEMNEQVVRLFHQTLREADTGSLTGIARQVMASMRRIGQTLWWTLRGRPVTATAEQEALLAGHWAQMEVSLLRTVRHYEQLCTAHSQRAGSNLQPGPKGARRGPGSP